MNLNKYPKKLNKKSPIICRKIAFDLNTLCEALDKIYAINSGGCCWVAHCLTKLLRNDGFRVDLVIYDPDMYTDGSHSINDVVEACNHYYIKVGGYSINQSDFTDKDYEVTFSDISEVDLLNHYKDNEWCCAYDHNDNNIVYKTLSMHYKRLIDGLRKEQ